MTARSLLIFLFLLTSCMIYGTPIDRKRILINHPTQEMMQRFRRDYQYYSYEDRPYRIEIVKVIAHPVEEKTKPTTPYPQLRKGEYICEDKVCKLKPGEVPKGCNGICQYPI